MRGQGHGKIVGSNSAPLSDGNSMAPLVKQVW